jgi:two-component system, cell cycle sensor histidine kinase and response regulator CckA
VGSGPGNSLRRGAAKSESGFAEGLRRYEGEMLRAILEVAPNPISLSRLSDHVIVEVNRAFLELSEYNRREIIGRTWKDLGLLGVPEERARLLQMLGDLGEVRDFPLECRTKAGRSLPVQVSARPIRLEGETLLLSICQDISGQRAVERALRDSDAKYRLLAENSTDVIWTMELDGRLTYVSPSVRSMLGFSPEELTGRPFDEHLTPESARKVRERLARELALPPDRRSPVALIECRQRRRDGVLVDIEISTNWVFDEGGEVVALQGTSREVTSRKRLQEQLRQSQKMEAIGLLAGGVAHDFNNILTSMTMSSELALRELPAESPAAAGFRQILELTQRASDLTRQLLTFSRQQPLRSVSTGVNRLIENLLKMIRRLIGEDIQLQFSAEASPDLTFADPGQIEQVLINLVVNARDAMPDGGRLAIRTRNESLEADFPARHPEAAPGQYVVIDVMDTGHGMDRETSERAFDPFFTTKEKGKGTGLGLSTVYGIVRQHEGFIAVDSVPGEGTTFHVWLPLCERPAPAAAGGADQQDTAGGHETLLLVEDEDSLRDLIAQMFESRGYHVLPAGRPAEALDIFRREEGRIDLLVTDIVMPGGTGTDLYRQLRDLKPDLRVLFMSGYTDRAVLHREVLRPDMPFLQKPFRMSELADRVRRLLDEGDE